MNRDLSFSATLHVFLFLALYWALVLRHPAPVTMELDLSQAPRIPAVASHHGFSKPTQAWAVPKHGLASPSRTTESAQEESTSPCPAPCPETPGDWVPADLAARQPRWTDGFITDEDYPKIAQRAGQDGKVLVAVYIDAAGSVRDVRLLQGSYPALNQVALDKLKTAHFDPAYDASGRPVPCRLILPIKFELN
jgi:protein TonB